jgi:PIN domain nuclease of toxin-antitoxin system
VILLDTHVLLWMACEPKRLSAKAREAIRNARQDKTQVSPSPPSLFGSWHG